MYEIHSCMPRSYTVDKTGQLSYTVNEVSKVTYQDFLQVGADVKDIANFIRKAINDHVSSELYKTARIADDYDRGQNTTILNYQKTITGIKGQKYQDFLSPTHRMASNYYHIFISQACQYLLSNGVTWKNEQTAKVFGNDFDNRLIDIATSALNGSVAYGFFNNDHVEVLPIYDRDKPSFVPITDEVTGELMMGIKFWQIADNKPLNAVMYEADGITEFMFSNADYKPIDSAWISYGNGIYAKNKYPYKRIRISSKQTGTQYYDGGNYSALPIIPMYGNKLRQSEIINLREKIDAYDFILNGFEDDLDNAQIYWIIRGAGGMDDADIVQFLDRLRTVKAAAPMDGQDVQAQAIQIPVEARERLLDRLDRQLYKDAQAFNPDDVKSGATVTAQINAAYVPLDLKTDLFEYCVLEFLGGLMTIANIQDNPTFTRNKLTNVSEEVQTLVTAATHLSSEYVTQKILTLFGDGDKVNEILKQMDAEDVDIDE